MAALKETYARWGALVILIKGLTPIPFKLVTIVSGLLGYNFAAFVGLSLVTRGARFFLLAGALNHFGDPLRLALERHFAVFLGIIAAMVVAGFVIATPGVLMSFVVVGSLPERATDNALAIGGLAFATIVAAWVFQALGYRPLRSLP